MESKKKALVFGGQGAQFVGMGKYIYSSSKKVRNVFEMAADITGKDIANLCFNSLQKEIKNTINSQLCTMTFELAMYELFKEQEKQINAVAGFSLGEYAALVVAEVIEIEEAFRLVKMRATAMEETVPDDIGKMYAIFNLSGNAIVTICCEIGYNNAAIANYNSHNQVVVAVRKGYCDKLRKIVKSMGGKSIELNVNRPYHHMMMKPAADLFRNELLKYRYNSPKCMLYSNVTGNIIDSNKIDVELYQQIYKPVLWTKIIENMLQEDITDFFEISPRKTLVQFIDNISLGTAAALYVE